MAFPSGTRLGPYEIVSPLGAGGMGEVYKGRDTRLDRIVAIKVLPEQLASDAQFRQRFEREARAVGSLNHPHICTLHDVGRHENVDFLVMEYLEGETLQDRLKRGALPIAEALQIGIQIADALAAAHRAGVVHRDLKPGNMMLTKAGALRQGWPQAKLLDFGLAKADSPAVAGSLSMLPTTPPGLTAQGTILGTFQYMAPEQLEGRETDARTDIFAFGSTLYEMLTGRKAFDGRSQASLIGAILKDTPPFVSATQPLATASLDRLVAQCLAKDPEDRWQSARDVMLQLKGIATGNEDARLVAPVDARSRRRDKPALAAAVIGLLVGAAALAGNYFEATAPDLGPIQFGVEASISSGSGNAAFAVSPDGRRLAFESSYSSTNTRSLWIRSLDSSTVQPLSGTEGTGLLNPFWSPDGGFIGFFADGKLKIISVAGGPPRILCDAPNSGGGAWGRDGTILFGSAIGPVYRVPEGGGTPVAATTLDESRLETGHMRPQFMPDGRHFLFLAMSSDLTKNATYVATLDSPERRPVDGVASSAAYVPPGHLIFARGDVLVAREFDANRLEGRGEPVPLGEVRQERGHAVFSVSPAGVLAYQPASASPETHLVWLTRDGKPVGDFPPRGGIHTLSLAPDHERAIVEELGAFWMLDSRRRTASRVTPDSSGTHPVWSSDGRRIAFSTGPTAGNSRLMAQVATGIAGAEAILDTPTRKQVTDWSLDGRTLVFEEQSRETGWNIGVVSVEGDRTPRVVIQGRFQERMGSLSPDGRYLAYTSDETGRTEVYVVTYPDVTDKWTISTSGGTAPRWRRDGSELFFLDPAGMLISVPVSRGAALSVGVPKALFDLQALPSDGFTYAIAADGQRILAARATSAPTSITVVVNWPALLNRPGGP